MGVSRSSVQWLRGGGHDIAHVADLGMKSASDAEILALALREQRIVLTFDLDFGHILAASRESAPSVIIFRIANARPERVNAHLETVLGDVATTHLLGEGAIVVVEDERRRVRKLPIGA
jgi:predicted nuclease of predicted toxin-antitoxin system